MLTILSHSSFNCCENLRSRLMTWTFSSALSLSSDPQLTKTTRSHTQERNGMALARRWQLNDFPIILQGSNSSSLQVSSVQVTSRRPNPSIHTQLNSHKTIKSLIYFMPSARNRADSACEVTFCSKTKFCGSERV